MSHSRVLCVLAERGTRALFPRLATRTLYALPARPITRVQARAHRSSPARPLPWRALAVSAGDGSATSAASLADGALAEPLYHRLADATLDNLTAALEDALDGSGREGDVQCASGVVTFTVGSGCSGHGDFI
jgi:hypothetical protein